MSSKEMKNLKRSFFRTISILELSVILNTIVTIVTISEFSHHVMVIPFGIQIKILWRILLLEQGAILLIAGLLKKLAIDPLVKNVKTNQEKADTDYMTGLYNRNHFNKMIEDFNEFDFLGVFFIDVNDLKVANDQYGHEAGDELITSVANVLKNLELEYCYRFGGDEFVVVVPDTQREQIEELKQIIFSKVSQIELSCDLKPTIALGVACGRFRDIKDLVREADEKMYQNKQKYKLKKNR